MAGVIRVIGRRFIGSNREILRERGAEVGCKNGGARAEAVVTRVGEGRGGTSKGVFAGAANLSDPIPTSRRKKTFDKRPNVLAKWTEPTWLESSSSLSAWTTWRDKCAWKFHGQLEGNRYVSSDRWSFMVHWYYWEAKRVEYSNDFVLWIYGRMRM